MTLWYKCKVSLYHGIADTCPRACCFVSHPRLRLQGSRSHLMSFLCLVVWKDVEPLNRTNAATHVKFNSLAFAGMWLTRNIHNLYLPQLSITRMRGGAEECDNWMQARDADASQSIVMRCEAVICGQWLVTIVIASNSPCPIHRSRHEWDLLEYGLKTWVPSLDHTSFVKCQTQT